MTEKGEHHTEASKNKMSDVKRGKPSGREGTHHSMESREKMRKSKLGKIGKLSNNWKGGRVGLSKLIRNSDKYTEWRASIFERDLFTCEICKHVGGDLEAHHIKYFYKILEENDISILEEALQCPELWDISNGICLCWECHNELHRTKVNI